MEELPDIDVSLTEMSVDDLKQLKWLYIQSQDYYNKLLQDTQGISETNIHAVQLCMAEIKKEIDEIDAILSQKLIPKESST